MNPLIFVVYRHNGVESPALHYEDHLPPKHDPVVYQIRIDKQPNAEALEAMTLAELYQRYRAERDRAAQR